MEVLHHAVDAFKAAQFLNALANDQHREAPPPALHVANMKGGDQSTSGQPRRDGFGDFRQGGTCHTLGNRLWLP